MLDLLKAKASPLDKAKTFIEDDNVQGLHDLMLTEPDSLSETTYVRSQSKYNLLHWCVKSKSAKCLRLLIRNFKWDPSLNTLINQDALDLAMTECYLPVLYEILRVNNDDWPRRVGQLKSQPPHFQLVNFLLFPSVEVTNKFMNVAYFEEDITKLEPSSHYLTAELLLTHCKDEHYDRSTDADFLSWFSDKKSNPSLSELARRTIRLSIVSRCLSASGPYHNYFYLVNQLPYPIMLKDYLCYIDLWPVQSRDSFIPYRRSTQQFSVYWRHRENLFDVVDMQRH